MKRAADRTDAFSLLEVAVAVGIMATVLVGLLAWFGPAIRTNAASGDVAVAAALADDIQLELERLQANLGLDGLAAAVPPPGSTAALRLVATRDGRRVRCADAPDLAADRPLNDAVYPGIARRDRYFLAEVVQLPDLPYRPGAGYLAVSVRISWPYLLPAGLAPDSADDLAAGAFREVPGAERRSVVVALALRP